MKIGMESSENPKETILKEVRKFVKNNASLRRRSVYQNSHEANTMFSPAYDLLKRVMEALDGKME